MDYLVELRRELDAFGALLDGGDLSAPVEHCGGWRLVDHALGRPTPMDPALAADGVAEVFDTMALRMIAKGAATPPSRAVRLTTTDTGHAWTYGPDEPVAQLSGTAEDLLLLLWGRKPRDTESVTWEGDREAGLAVLAGPLVP
ncbi:hypothetical protein [Streptomyces antibioticus]|uniref:MDMPI C-terminal domain-containing protein n=1 Tax=Streptomyces antibioticus TaxID=1890 RepID=A0AAE7CNC8_STRAT|nr:hypothetical protein [Streptomyces antibioticus]OOQ46983.1 hypothetical protein AFM16_29780 [Streptomyces antibioticus]QIT47284.1 hypothetical protein HCX60_30315 [Streptomyces antibioticus]